MSQCLGGGDSKAELGWDCQPRACTWLLFLAGAPLLCGSFGWSHFLFGSEPRQKPHSLLRPTLSRHLTSSLLHSRSTKSQPTQI